MSTRNVDPAAGRAGGAAGPQGGAEPTIRVLGPLEIVTDGDRLELPSGRTQIVLGALALHAGQVVSADRLITAAWGDAAPATVRTQLQGLVSALRTALRPVAGVAILTRTPGYLLETAADAVDLDVFQTRVREARAARDLGRYGDAAEIFRGALTIWRGAAFEGSGSAYLEAEALVLREVRLQVFEEYSHLLFGLGRHAEVVAAAERAVRAHPLRESLRGVLMLALAGSGRQAEALEVFQQGRRRLIQELGVDPGADLQQVHQAVLNGSAMVVATQPGARPEQAAPSAASAVVPAQLPADVADFTGRKAEVDRVVAELSRVTLSGGGAPVVICSIAGTGGVGKTTLAVHTGHGLSRHFEDGQLYANLLGTSPTPIAPAEVLARFLRGLGVEDAKIPFDAEERAAAYRSTLAGRRVLIVLDDVCDAAQVRPLLPGAPGCGVLVTSRSRLPGLDGCTRLDLDVFGQAEAEDLFTRIVGDRGGDRDPEAVADILACCGGLPLAIRIAAARLLAQPGWTLRMLADELGDRSRVLDGLQVEDRAVRASFALSHAYLDAETARGFALLGLWAGPRMPFDAACALFDRDGDQTGRILDALLAIHLLYSPEPQRYRFHDLIKAYAAEQAEATLSASERREAIGRTASWFVDAITAATALLEPGLRRPATVSEQSAARLAEAFPDAPTALAWCDRERSNLAAIVAGAVEAGHDAEAWKIAVTAQAYYHRGCHWADWEDTHQIALAAARRLGDGFAEAWTLNGLGVLRMRTRRLDEGTELLLQARTIREAIDDRLGLAQTTSSLGTAYVNIGHTRADSAAFEKAVECYRAAIALYEEAGHEYGAATPMTNLGSTYFDLRRYDEAVEQLTAALALNRRVGNRPSEAVALHGLGDVAAARGDLEAARTSYELAIGVRQAIGDRFGEAVVLKDLAEIDLREGAGAAAALAFERAADLVQYIDPAESGALRRRAAELRAPGADR